MKRIGQKIGGAHGTRVAVPATVDALVAALRVDAARCCDAAGQAKARAFARAVAAAAVGRVAVGVDARPVAERDARLHADPGAEHVDCRGRSVTSGDHVWRVTRDDRIGRRRGCLRRNEGVIGRPDIAARGGEHVDHVVTRWCVLRAEHVNRGRGAGQSDADWQDQQAHGGILA